MGLGRSTAGGAKKWWVVGAEGAVERVMRIECTETKDSKIVKER